MHTALAFYGIIPEAIVQTTAVGTLKKNSFENDFGTFTYQRILPRLMFGYKQKELTKNIHILMATPEKAILDLLYLYPIYNNEIEMKELRFDSDFMEEELNLNQLQELKEKFQSKTVEKRVKTLLKAYNLC